MGFPPGSGHKASAWEEEDYMANGADDLGGTAKFPFALQDVQLYLMAELKLGLLHGGDNMNGCLTDPQNSRDLFPLVVLGFEQN